MERITPDTQFYGGMPCSFVAINCARYEEYKKSNRLRMLSPVFTEIPDGLRADGYLTLNNANKYVRKYFKVRKRTNYKRGERPLLKDLHLKGSAIVVVLGHCIYVDGERYWSYFENEYDDVVAVWEIDGIL